MELDGCRPISWDQCSNPERITRECQSSSGWHVSRACLLRLMLRQTTLCSRKGEILPCWALHKIGWSFKNFCFTYKHTRNALTLEVCQGCNLKGAKYLPELWELSIFPLKLSRVLILPLSIPPTSLLSYFCAAWHNTIRHLEVLRVVHSSSKSSFFWFILPTVWIIYKKYIIKNK